MDGVSATGTWRLGISWARGLPTTLPVPTSTRTRVIRSVRDYLIKTLRPFFMLLVLQKWSKLKFYDGITLHLFYVGPSFRTRG